MSAAIRQKRLDGLFFLALLVSVILHLLGGVGSQYIHVADIHSIEKDVAELFNVELVDLGAQPIERPDLARDAAGNAEARIEQELERLEALPARDARDAIEQMLSNEAPLDPFGDEDRLKLLGSGVPDAAPPALISSEQSRRSVSTAGDTAGLGTVDHVDKAQPVRVGSAFEARKQRLLGGLESAQKPAEPQLPLPLASFSISGPMGAGLSLELGKPQVETSPPSLLGRVNVGLDLPDPFSKPLLATNLPQTESDQLDERRQQVVNLDDLLVARIFVYRPPEGPGYFHLMIMPQRADSRLQPLPKDVIFVLDASQSIGQRTLGKLKDGIKEAMRRLGTDDRFTIIGFRNKALQYSENLVPVNPLAVAEAWSFVDSLNASGRTDIYSAMEQIMKLGTQRARPHIIVLFSDGRPNVGITDSRNIINRLSASRAPSTTIYSFGAGNSINHYLLDLLAYRNRGYAVYSDERSDIPFDVQTLMSELEKPVLMRVQADMPGLDNVEVYPKQLPDLYQNWPLNLYGRIHDQDEIVLRITGEAFDETKEVVLRVPIPKETNGDQEVARDWAKQKLMWLIGQTVQLGETPSLMQEISRIGQQYNVQTGYEAEFGG